MTITINGNGTVTGISVGGLPDGIVDTDMLAANAVTTAKSTVTPGITHLDTWLLTADKNWSGGNLLDADVSRSTIFGNIGDAMTKSGSTFTFPATGIWELDFRLLVSDATENAYAYAQINYTTNNGTAWAELVESADAIPDDGSNATFANPYCHVTFDVTDVSTHKIQLRSVNEQGAVVKGNSTRMFSGCIFKRIGDT